MSLEDAGRLARAPQELEVGIFDMSALSDDEMVRMVETVRRLSRSRVSDQKFAAPLIDGKAWCAVTIRSSHVCARRLMH